MEGFNSNKYNESISKREYAFGKNTDYYIITVKIKENHYKLLLLENHKTKYKGYEDGLNKAKFVGLEKLYKHNPLALNTNMVSMVHYKQNRNRPWHKDTNNELQKNIEMFLNSIDFSFPTLKPNSRNREYNNYDIDIHSKVIFEYLFNERSHRWIDENVINIDPNYSRGYQSMGILHFIGLQDTHKGIFNGISVDEAIRLLSTINDNNVEVIIKALIHLNNLTYIYDNSEYGMEIKEYPEGKEAYKVHRFRERNSKVIIDAKKDFKKKYGELFCQVCGINFEKLYGERGKDFIEAHHTKPISKMKDREKTRIEDIVMLCSNCHRMIHRSPIISIEELKNNINI
ncbi:HNH endonuclease [Ornithinibacillus salinisoli]|uniref:HNH endonuclease n=1 Tax=Ornithinibacillus salinisoli TaxID=1848459 RepID=A0ABW4W427_9BACI